MMGKRTTSLIAMYLLLQCLLCLTLVAKAQKNGFRGGAKSYEIQVQATTMGTNLHYKLPESKVKAASKQDWLVDNDNADLLAINSPVLAQVNVKHPKFSMKGQWPGYKTSFKLPEDVSVASKRHDFAKSKHVKQQKIGPETEKINKNIFGGDQDSKGQTTTHKGPVSSRDAFPKVIGQFFKRRNAGRKLRHEGSPEMLNISRFLLPITGLNNNIDLKNPLLSKAMKGVIKHARKVVGEAKMVLSDAARFITRVRKLVKVTKDHTNANRKEAKTSNVGEKMQKTSSKYQAKNAAKHHFSLSQEESIKKQTKMNGAKRHDTKGQESLQTRRHRKQDTTKVKGVSKRSYLDSTETKKAREQERESRVKRRELPDTLESILFTINGLKNLLRYH